MNIRRLIGRLLATFVVVGLVMAPLVAPVAAKQSAVAEMSDVSAMSDMFCCPDGSKNKGCTDCPLVATCMLTVAQAEPATSNAISVRFPTRSCFPAIDDLIGDGLIGVPPDHPPRTSI